MASVLRGYRDRTAWVKHLSGSINACWHLRQGPSMFERLLDDVMCLAGGRHATPLEGKERDAVFKLSGLYAEAVADLPPFTELLGAVYMDLASHGHRQGMGQFFTPPHICKLMAQINLGDCDVGKQVKPIRIMEPCAGSGSMLLAMCEVILESGGKLPDYHLTAIDLDVSCVKMTTVQFMANAFIHDLRPGKLDVFQGNSLDPTNCKPFFSMTSLSSDKTDNRSAEEVSARKPVLEKWPEEACL